MDIQLLIVAICLQASTFYKTCTLCLLLLWDCRQSPTPGPVEEPVKPDIVVTDAPVLLPSSNSQESIRAESRVESKATSEAPSNPTSTLYEKLGGPEALEAAVDLFYEKVLADERLSGFFEGTNMMRLVIRELLISGSSEVAANGEPVVA